VPISSPKGQAGGGAAPGQLRRAARAHSGGSSSDSDGGGGRGGGRGGGYASSAASSSGAAPCSVQSCLAAFVEPEVLDGEERYSCARCKSAQPANKRLLIYHYPRVLVLALKRFASDGTGLGGISSRLFGGGRYGSTRKNSTAVQLEVDTLDLRPYCSPQGAQESLERHGAGPVYELVAVSNHSGSLYGGHYTASARLPGSSWYGFDDTHVAREAAPGGASSAAYVLFYRLVDLAAG
jgi:ubiquitin C-terminal hydrolase